MAPNTLPPILDKKEMPSKKDLAYGEIKEKPFESMITNLFLQQIKDGFFYLPQFENKETRNNNEINGHETSGDHQAEQRELSYTQGQKVGKSIFCTVYDTLKQEDKTGDCEEKLNISFLLLKNEKKSEGILAKAKHAIQNIFLAKKEETSEKKDDLSHHYEYESVLMEREELKTDQEKFLHSLKDDTTYKKFIERLLSYSKVYKHQSKGGWTSSEQEDLFRNDFMRGFIEVLDSNICSGTVNTREGTELLNSILVDTNRSVGGNTHH